MKKDEIEAQTLINVKTGEDFSIDNGYGGKYRLASWMCGREFVTVEIKRGQRQRKEEEKMMKY